MANVISFLTDEKVFSFFIWTCIFAVLYSKFNLNTRKFYMCNMMVNEWHPLFLLFWHVLLGGDTTRTRRATHSKQPWEAIKMCNLEQQKDLQLIRSRGVDVNKRTVTSLKGKVIWPQYMTSYVYFPSILLATIECILQNASFQLFC